VFAGQNIGIKEVEEKIWLVSFMHYDLGFFDHQSGRIECAENPFSAKVLVVSIGRRNTPANLRLGGVRHDDWTSFDDHACAAGRVLAAV
jgi:hypothetical protein